MIPAQMLHTMGRLAAVAALKIKFLQQMAPLKAMLISRLGPQFANIAVGTLASAAAAAYFAQKTGKSADEVERAAEEAGARGAGKEIAAWLRDNF
jgi:hypothetical protein